MSPQLPHPPKALVFALLLSPLLGFFPSCGDDAGEDQSVSADGSGANRAHKSSPARVRPPTSPSPLPADLSSALETLTAANASRVRDHLAARPRPWPSQVAPFYRAWATLDPEPALHAANREGALALSATLGALEGWTTQDHFGARNWLDTLENETLRARYARSLVKAWPEGQLTDLAQWSQSLPSLLPQVTARWSGRHPQQAAQWLSTQSALPTQRQATEALFRRWASDDPTAAGRFLTSSAAFPHRDQALAAYAAAVSADDPKRAQAWAATITDPDLRQLTLRSLQNTTSLTSKN